MNGYVDGRELVSQLLRIMLDWETVCNEVQPYECGHFYEVLAAAHSQVSTALANAGVDVSSPDNLIQWLRDGDYFADGLLPEPGPWYG